MYFYIATKLLKMNISVTLKYILLGNHMHIPFYLKCFIYNYIYPYIKHLYTHTPLHIQTGEQTQIHMHI